MSTGRLMIALLSLAAACAAGVAGSGADDGAAPTVDEIVARHVAARGGAEQLAALSSLRREGIRRATGRSAELKVVELVTRPGLIRRESSMQGMTAIVAWDGREAWQVQPFGGRKDPDRMSAGDASPLRLAADLETPLVNYRAKGHEVQYLGMEDVDGTPAHKLRVKLKDGGTVTYYVDPDSWMIIRDVQQRVVRGSEREVETDYGEYEKVGGVYVPMSEERGRRGSDPASKEKTSYSAAEVNVPVSPALFAFPAGR